MYQRQEKDTELRSMVAEFYRLVTKRGHWEERGGMGGSGEADAGSDPVGRENQERARQFVAQQEGEARAVEEGMIREAGERRAGAQMDEMDETPPTLCPL